MIKFLAELLGFTKKSPNIVVETPIIPEVKKEEVVQELGCIAKEVIKSINENEWVNSSYKYIFIGSFRELYTCDNSRYEVEVRIIYDCFPGGNKTITVYLKGENLDYSPFTDYESQEIYKALKIKEQKLNEKIKELEVKKQQEALEMLFPNCFLK